MAFVGRLLVAALGFCKSSAALLWLGIQNLHFERTRPGAKVSRRLERNSIANLGAAGDVPHRLTGAPLGSRAITGARLKGPAGAVSLRRRQKRRRAPTTPSRTAQMASLEAQSAGIDFFAFASELAGKLAGWLDGSGKRGASWPGEIK